MFIPSDGQPSLKPPDLTQTRFAVWAPEAGRVELELDGTRIGMKGAARGWWSVEAPASPRSEYVFWVDGEGPLPDPRSVWQPRGVHGPSALWDHAGYSWSDQGFVAPPLETGLLYELHIGTFTPAGTFTGALSRLDHLAQLGVTHVELMPVAAFAGARGWGYDGAALFSPHPAYGTPDDLKRLVDECHARGMAVLLDVVYNHLGPSGNFLPRFGPYFTDRHRTPWGPAVNLEAAGADEVRRFFIDNARQWLLQYHMDGLRVDAVHAFMDRSAVPFGEELTAAVHDLAVSLGRPLVVIAESDLNDPRVVRGPEVGGWGCDAQWSDDFHHALHTVLTGERAGYYVDFGGLRPLAKALAQGFVFDGVYSAARDRRHGRRPWGVPLSRFVGFSQNHDQIGNRARGERLSHLAGPGRAKIAAALVLTAPFVPLLFQGEEWATSAPFLYFTDHEPQLGAAVTRGRREEFAAFGWRPEEVPDPQAEETFAASKLDWTEIERDPHRGMLEWYRRLIELRRRLPDLADGATAARMTFDERESWLRVDRGALFVAVNLGAESVRVPLVPETDHRLLLSSEPAEIASGSVNLPPNSVAIGQNGA
jgi:maltooligosyltrehalose trehalohydrolase